MTVREFLARVDSRELTEWNALFEIHAQESHPDVVVHDGDDPPVDDDESEDGSDDD